MGVHAVGGRPKTDENAPACAGTIEGSRCRSAIASFLALTLSRRHGRTRERSPTGMPGSKSWQHNPKNTRQRPPPIFLPPVMSEQTGNLGPRPGAPLSQRNRREEESIPASMNLALLTTRDHSVPRIGESRSDWRFLSLPVRSFGWLIPGPRGFRYLALETECF